MPFHVYILRCSDDSLYVGHTADLESRVALHNEGRASAFTASRRPVVLAFSEPCDTADEARKRERQIKRWTRAKKLALISGEIESLTRRARRIRSQDTSAGRRSW